MVAKKNLLYAVRKSKCFKSMAAVKPSMGDGLIYGAVFGFLMGLAIGINANKSGEDLGTFALECGIKGSVACAFAFGLFFAVRMALKIWKVYEKISIFFSYKFCYYPNHLVFNKK